MSPWQSRRQPATGLSDEIRHVRAPGLTDPAGDGRHVGRVRHAAKTLGPAASDASGSEAVRGPARAETDGRLTYVDDLRVAVIVGVFLVHVSEVFNPWDEWHIANGERSRLIGEIAVSMAPWIMPLVMLLAGVSAWYSLRTRTNRAYLRERVVRVLVPLVVGTLVLSPPQVYLERRLRGQFSGSFWAFLPHFFDGIYPTGNLSWHHLWFLAHLFVYSVVALPIFRYWQRNGTESLSWLKRVASGRGILWLAAPLVIERQLLWGVLPERHMLTSDWSNHAILFVAYLYGFLLAGDRWLGEAIDSQWRGALLVGTAVTTLLIAGTWGGVVPGRIPPPYSAAYLAFWSVYAVGAWAWMAGVVGAARHWRQRDSAVLRYGHTMGYVWYIVHQPVIIAVAYVVVQRQAGVGVKFLTLLVVSLGATLVISELLRLTLHRLIGSDAPQAHPATAGAGAAADTPPSVRWRNAVMRR